MTTAVVVGAGPNGLSAAVRLATQGVEVTVIEAAETIGGGTRSGELTLPGLIHDHCSGFHPMGAGSPYLQTLDLAEHGLHWEWADIDCAHPLDGGDVGLMYRSLDATAEGLGIDGERWRAVFGSAAEHFDDLANDLMRPVANIPRHPLALASFGPRALSPATLTSRVFRTPRAKALFTGLSAHLYARLDRPFAGAVALLLTAAGHNYGWPVARGGSASITDALAAKLTAHDGTIVTGTPVRTAADIPAADVVLLDVSPAVALDIYGDSMPKHISGSYRRFRRAPGAYKVDFAVESGVPWADPDTGRAGTVHVGGSAKEVADAERKVFGGSMPERPFVLVGQQYVADPSRSRGDVHPLYAYAHVPNGYTGDATEAVIAQIERFAPGFRDRILATTVTTPAQLETSNANYGGGDIVGGSNSGLQVLFRPRAGIDPYSMGIPGAYLCSASTPPGAGAHGMCGYNAAESALRYLRKR